MSHGYIKGLVVEIDDNKDKHVYISDDQLELPLAEQIQKTIPQTR